MIIQNREEEKLLKEASAISVKILDTLGKQLREGVTPLDIDTLAGHLCKEYGVVPSFKTVQGYNFNTCISVNDVAVHGIPKDIPLKKGDLISIDFGIVYKGFFTDHCWTWSIGEPNKENERLLKAGREAVESAMELAVVGNHTGDLGFEMESVAKRYGFNVLKMFIGHGIGKGLHEAPDIPAFGKRDTGTVLEDGMVLCVECQVVDDSGEVVIDRDGWSAKTKNGGNSVMFEYMVIVRDSKPEILTDTKNWNTVV
ncbi:MAG: type I methionyl aminopeptidase [Candidatus Dojkabacteria bacterium]